MDDTKADEVLRPLYNQIRTLCRKHHIAAILIFQHHEDERFVVISTFKHEDLPEILEHMIEDLKRSLEDDPNVETLTDLN